MHNQYKLGRIFSIDMALGGRYNSELGLLITMGADKHNGQDDSAWSVTSFEGVFYTYTKGQEKLSASLVNHIGDMLTKADVISLSELVHKPVMCVFEEGVLVSWNLWERTM